MLLAIPPWTYSALMLLAMIASALLFQVTGRRLPLTASQRGAILLGALCGSFILARIPYLFGDVAALCTVQGWIGNGKTILFGLMGGYLGVELAKRWVGVRTSTGDSFAVPVAVGIAIGRLACFNGGCCFGTPTTLPWGVDFGDAVPRHPTQIYESLFHVTMAVLLGICLHRGWFRGRLIRVYFMTYAGYRFLTEFIRPEPRVALGLTWYQFVCLGLIVLLLMLDRFATRESLEQSTSGTSR